MTEIRRYYRKSIQNNKEKFKLIFGKGLNFEGEEIAFFAINYYYSNKIFNQLFRNLTKYFKKLKITFVI